MKFWNPVKELCSALADIAAAIREEGGKTVSEIDDLKNAVSDITTAVQNAANELSKLAADVRALKNQSLINPLDVEAAAQAIEAQANALGAATGQAIASTISP